MVRNITLRVLAYLLLLIVLVVATCYFLSEDEYIPVSVSCGTSGP